MGIDLDGNGELVDAFQTLFLDPLSDLGDAGDEGLAADHDVAGVGGHAVDAEGVIGVLDLVELGAVQEEFHDKSLLF